MQIDNTKIVEALAAVMDPASGRDIISQSMVRDLKVEGKNISFVVELTAGANDKKQELNFACMEAIQKIYPEANVHVHMKGKGDTPGHISTAPVNPLPQIKNIIAIGSGKGGVGKSTVTVNLALALKESGAKIGILDADLYGPSIPTMLGLSGQKPKLEHVYGQPKIVPLEAYGMPVMSMGFVVEPEQAVVLRGPRLAGVLGQFLTDCIWPELDYLLIDLPPGTGDIQLTMVQSVPVTGAVMVTTPQDVAMIDAVKAMNMFLMSTVKVPILGVVENMAWFTPAELPNNKYPIFGEGGGKKLAELGKTPLLGQVPLVMSVREGGDSGKPIVLDANNPASKVFFEIAEELKKSVAERNAKIAPTQVVEITTQ